MRKDIVKIWKEHSVVEATILTFCVAVGYSLGWFGGKCLRALTVMLLWNWVMVELFSAPTLTFWVAFGLQWLCSLLFKSVKTINKNSKN